MKKASIPMFLCAVFLNAHGQSAQETAEQQCQQAIDSMVPIFKQLKSTPNLRTTQIDAVINGHTENFKLRRFIKLEIVPAVLTLDDKPLETYIQSGVGRLRCEQILNFYSVQ